MQNRFLENIEEVSTEKEYWFVRTDSGNYFHTFLTNRFIGINWNNITLSDLENRTEIEVKNKIALTEKFDPMTRAGKQRATDIYNKLIRFKNLQRGDIVVIPSENSSYLAFGEVVDNIIYTELPDTNQCSYAKRRRINWLTAAEDMDKLDPTFFKIKKSRHSISSIKNYDYYIDSLLYDVYTKDNYSHFVIKIDTTKDINLSKLSDVLKGLHQIMIIANNEFQLGENIDNSYIRIYLQSPGLFNIKYTGLALLLAASLLGSTGCNVGAQPQHVRQQIDSTYQRNQAEIDSVRDKMRDLDIKL